jgi:O-antigen ligase
MNKYRVHVLFYCFISMLIALFFSRAMLSVFIAIFFAASFCHSELKKQVKQFFSTPLLWGISLLFLIPLLSGLWSDDKKEWLDIIRIKMPLLFLPLAFAGPFHFTKKLWQWLAVFFTWIITAATVWVFFHYLNNFSEINEGYLKAKTIITPLENDHVRFSWLVCIAALLSGWLFVQLNKENKTASWLMVVITTWLIIFLHILAARTGLISFYIILMGILAWLLFKRMNRKYIIVLLLLLFVFPFLAYLSLPTFKNRVKYFLYDKEFFSKTHYLPGGNDAVRVISLKAGMAVMNQHPVTGAGFGDIYSETKRYYDSKYPQMLESDKIYPSGEWMMYGAGCGWPGFLLFSFVMLIPFWIKTNNKLLWWLLNSTAAFGFLFDIGLEVQFGVFIYSFIILWWWKWMKVSE